MTATAVAPPVASIAPPSSSWSRAGRVVLVALVIVVMLVGAFVIGRATATSAHAIPAVVRTPRVTPTTTFCRLGRPC